MDHYDRHLVLTTRGKSVMDEHLIDIEGRRSGWSASTSSIWKIAEHKLPVNENMPSSLSGIVCPMVVLPPSGSPIRSESKPPEPRAQALAKLQIVLNLSFDPP